MREHPAPFNAAVLQIGQAALTVVAPHGAKVLDPFAGVGGVHKLTGFRTVGVELEPEWAAEHPATEVGNALNLRWRRGSFDVIFTSPCFANRMADHHNARDTSVRHTYRHVLGRDLSLDSAAVLQWGPEYQDFHIRAIIEATRVCKKRAWWVLNMSDHFRTGMIQPVTGWWIQAMTDCGWEWTNAVPVPTQRLRHGANAKLRVKNEWVLMFERVA